MQGPVERVKTEPVCDQCSFFFFKKNGFKTIFYLLLCKNLIK